MELRSQNIVLREFVPADVNAIHALHSLPETDEFNTLGIPSSLAETEALVKLWTERRGQAPRASYVFVIENMHQEFVGLFGLNMGKPKYRNAEVWYKIHKDFWGKGYATEALKRVLDFCFNTLNLHRVEAGCAVDNAASVKVLEKAGMIREGQTRKLLPIRGNWSDNYFYAILEEDYFGEGQ